MDKLPPRTVHEYEYEKVRMYDISKNVKSNFQLKSYNTLKVSAFAKYFVNVNNIEELIFILQHNNYIDLPKFILGGGSNILFKNNFDGIVIKINIQGIEVEVENKNFVYLKIGAGVKWQDLVDFCVNKNYPGLENMSLIPGTVGAAPIQNIGAYGAELKSIFYKLQAVEIASCKKVIFSKEDCKFGYRDSIFKNELAGKYVITNVWLKLYKHATPKLSYKELQGQFKNTQPTIKQVSEAVKQIRINKLPNLNNYPNAGSFFKNPSITIEEYTILKKKYPNIPCYKNKNYVKIPAAWLIEQAGWKGKTINNVTTHTKQPLVIINDHASGAEVYKYAKQVQLAVKAKFGISLEYEVNII